MQQSRIESKLQDLLSNPFITHMSDLFEYMPSSLQTLLSELRTIDSQIIGK